MFGSQGSFRLFRVKGIDVYLNWTWFLVALFEIQARNGTYSSVLWNILEYVALFAIVLTHEFGHAFACRSVGGQADTIMLWPLGGVAYVNPPPRPGALLWSIVAGPLVNFGLFRSRSCSGISLPTRKSWACPPQESRCLRTSSSRRWYPTSR